MRMLDEKLEAGEVILLDGGTGAELDRLGVPMDGIAWCALANKTHPEVVRQVHESYIRAGADVVTANTFSTSRNVLGAVGLGDEVAAINRRAVALAMEARESAAGPWPSPAPCPSSHPSSPVPIGRTRRKSRTRTGRWPTTGRWPASWPRRGSISSSWR